MVEIMPFMVPIAIVAIVFGSRAWRTYLLTKQRTGRSAEDDRLISSMEAQIGKLSDRVAVLERLVTDEDRKLASEIERLRDRPGANL
jgi:hypothetical protein